MTERKAGGPGAAGPPTPGSPSDADPPGGGDKPSGEERVVVRDKRRVDPTGTRPRTPKAAANGTPEPAATEPADPPEVVEAEVVEAAEPLVGEVVEESAEAGAAAGEEATEEEAVRPFGAELEALRAELDERTRDLQRVSAEYANYRKRVERDRALVVEQATGSVLTTLLPVLDDLDRARDHGDLVGPFGAVAEQLTAALAKFGLTPFGEKGDPFDPTRHEAVAHLTSAEVTEPTCVDVLRRGYLLGDRLIRAALVAVADPEQQQ